MYKLLQPDTTWRQFLWYLSKQFQLRATPAGEGGGVIKRLSTRGSITKSEHYTDTDIFIVVVAAMSMLAMVFMLVNLEFSELHRWEVIILQIYKDAGYAHAVCRKCLCPITGKKQLNINVSVYEIWCQTERWCVFSQLWTWLLACDRSDDTLFANVQFFSEEMLVIHSPYLCWYNR